MAKPNVLVAADVAPLRSATRLNAAVRLPRVGQITRSARFRGPFGPFFASLAAPPLKKLDLEYGCDAFLLAKTSELLSQRTVEHYRWCLNRAVAYSCTAYESLGFQNWT